MASPEFKQINPTYKKEGSNVWVLNKEDIPVDGKVVDEQIVHLGPGGVGGNHKHPRTEWFVGIGELIFLWLDDEGVKRSENMNPNGELMVITVPPFLPHAVINNSSEKSGIIFELADAKQSEVEHIKVI